VKLFQDSSTVVYHLKALLFTDNQPFINREVLLHFMHGLEYASINSQSAELYLMWVLQLSKKSDAQ